jgi:hypothetical protein
MKLAQDIAAPASVERAHALSWLGRTEIWDRLALMTIAFARSALTETRNLALSLGYVDRHFTTECGLAEAEALEGNPAIARRILKAALVVARSGHDKIADAWALLAEVELELGRFRAAAQASRKALTQTTVVNRAQVCLQITNLAEARCLSGFATAFARTLNEAEDCAAKHVNLWAKRSAICCGRSSSELRPQARGRGLLTAERVVLDRAGDRLNSSRPLASSRTTPTVARSHREIRGRSTPGLERGGTW